ncbi:MAG: hypothetical protein HRT40_01805 [Campylobacteraceae bacterium]|nr:hypothetical protein [Campylobacteraceae bacterium]
MTKINYIVVVIIAILSFTGCVITGPNGIPNGGAAIIVQEQVWLSGIKSNEDSYSSSFPKAEENEYLKVIKAGYWLANTQGKKSQLVYYFKVNIKKEFSNKKVWTKMTLSNPSNENKDIVYTHYLSSKDKYTGGTHATLSNVKLNKKYNMIIEVFSDENRTKLISKLNQTIISPVDNSSGCIKLNRELKQEKYGHLVDGTKILSLDHLIILCDKNKRVPNLNLQNTDLPDAEYWTKNLDSYYKIPKDWFVERRIENDASSIYITKDKFDKNEQFKIGFSLHYIKNCKNNLLQNPDKLIPSFYVKNKVTNLAFNMNRTIVHKPYTFKDNHLIGYGVTTKNDKYTMRSIALGDDINNVCLSLIFEAPNKDWKSVETVGHEIMSNHWKK